MWDDIESQLKPELSPQEKLLWSGRPRTGIVFRVADIFLIPFSVVWCGFAIFWEFMAIGAGAPVPFALFGVPFIVIGLYLVFGRFIVESKTRGTTYYGVTNERVIIITQLFRRSIKSLNIETLADISLTERRDGSGTISLGPEHPLRQWHGNVNWPGVSQYAVPSLEMIPNARQVYEIVRTAQRDAKKNA